MKLLKVVGFFRVDLEIKGNFNYLALELHKCGFLVLWI